MGLEPLCGFAELLLLLVLLCFLFIDYFLQCISFSLLLESLIPLFSDLLQILSCIFVLLLHNVFLLVLVFHVSIVGLKCLRVSFISQFILASQVPLFLSMLLLCILKLFSELANARLKLLNSLLVSFHSVILD